MADETWTIIARTDADQGKSGKEGTADPLGQAKLIAPGLSRQWLAVVGDAYREYLRGNDDFSSYPIPQGSGELPAVNAYHAGSELLSEREAAKIHTQRRLAQVSRIRYSGKVTVAGIVFYKPGQNVDKIKATSGAGEFKLQSCLQKVTIDYPNQRTIVELG